MTKNVFSCVLLLHRLGIFQPLFICCPEELPRVQIFSEAQTLLFRCELPEYPRIERYFEEEGCYNRTSPPN